MTCRSLVMFADDDLVTPHHVIDMYAALPNAELAIVPGTSHFLTQEKPDLVNKMVVDFLTTRAGANGRAHPPSAQARGQSRLAAALAYPGADLVRAVVATGQNLSAHPSWTTDRTFPAGSVNHAIKRPWPR